MILDIGEFDDGAAVAADVCVMRCGAAGMTKKGSPERPPLPLRGGGVRGGGAAHPANLTSPRPSPQGGEGVSNEQPETPLTLQTGNIPDSFHLTFSMPHRAAGAVR